MDQPSLMIWCITTIKTQSSAAMRNRETRNRGPFAKSKGHRAAAESCASTSLSRSGRGSMVKSDVAGKMAKLLATTCCGSPLIAGKVVRSTSWRTTM